MSNDKKVGYKHPPSEYQFKKGRCPNPYGRAGKPGKPETDTSETALIDRIDNETVEVNGQKMTKREAQIRVLQARALKGDIRAYQELQKLRISARQQKQSRQGGVLLLPSPVPLDEWEATTARQQAKYRGEDPEGLAALNGRELGEEDD